MPIYRDKKRGTFVFEFDVRIGGERVRATKHLPKTWNRAQADEFDRKESAALYARAQGIGRNDQAIEDAVNLYLMHRATALKHGRNVAAELALIYPHYKGRPMSALPDVCKAIQIKGAGLSPATLKNRISYLRAACRYAWKHHDMGDADPGARVSVPTVRNERHVYITRAEMLRMARACRSRPVRALIRIAYYSGMRLGEIERAQVIDGRFVLTDTKNGDPRIIPIHPRIVCCLGYPKINRASLHFYFSEARAAIKRPDLHFHDLRHSAASEMINQGVDLYTVGAVLGHRSAASMKRYAHLATDRLEEAIRKIGKRA